MIKHLMKSWDKAVPHQVRAMVDNEIFSVSSLKIMFILKAIQLSIVKRGLFAQMALHMKMVHISILKY